jgi:hypothetical protein
MEGKLVADALRAATSSDPGELRVVSQHDNTRT